MAAFRERAGMVDSEAAIPLVAKWLREASSAVAFTGAGISTESGIPDYRSPGGVWATNRMIYFQEFLEDEDARREAWRQKVLVRKDFQSATPNEGHRVLAKWEREGRLRGVITQNIDGLHQLGGSQHVLELHGTAREVICLECRRRWPAEEWDARFEATGEAPLCPDCGGYLKHAIISFGQQLEPSVMQEAWAWARKAELFIALGSSLLVEPAASLPLVAKERGARLVILNRDETPLDRFADLVIRAPLGKTLSTVDAAMSAVTHRPT
jgi:NAD-dependent deacetylase